MSPHLAYVLAAYGLSAAGLAAFGAWIMLDSRARRRDLAALDQAGLGRRSETGKP